MRASSRSFFSSSREDSQSLRSSLAGWKLAPEAEIGGMRVVAQEVSNAARTKTAVSRNR